MLASALLGDAAGFVAVGTAAAAGGGGATFAPNVNTAPSPSIAASDDRGVGTGVLFVGADDDNSGVSRGDPSGLGVAPCSERVDVAGDAELPVPPSDERTGARFFGGAMSSAVDDDNDEG